MRPSEWSSACLLAAARNTRKMVPLRTRPQTRAISSVSMPEPPLDQFSAKPEANWFPGHMHKALLDIQKRLENERIGMVIEVRDARIPLSCINWRFERLFGDHRRREKSSRSKLSLRFRDAWGETVGVPLHSLKRMVVYNKADLVDGPDYVSALAKNPRDTEPTKWRQMLKEQHDAYCRYPLLFSSVSGNQRSGVDQVLLTAVREWIQHHRPAMQSRPHSPYPPLKIMVAGLPNTGKSSLINALRVYGLGYGSHTKKRIADVGKNPGMTRSVSGNIKILDTETIALSSTSAAVVNQMASDPSSETPVARMLRAENIRLRVYLTDSPGVLPPHIADPHTALKLGLVNCLPNDPNGRGADPIALWEYLWWRISDRWGLAEKVCASLRVPAPQNNTMFKGMSAPRQVLDEVARRRGTIRKNGDPDLSTAALHLVKLWREGVLYSQMGLYPPLSFYDRDGQLVHPEDHNRQDRRRVMHDLWHLGLVDDEFSVGDEAISDWFSSHYGRPKHSRQISAGQYLINRSESMNAKERRQERKRFNQDHKL